MGLQDLDHRFDSGRRLQLLSFARRFSSCVARCVSLQVGTTPLPLGWSLERTSVADGLP